MSRTDASTVADGSATVSPGATNETNRTMLMAVPGDMAEGSTLVLSNDEAKDVMTVGDAIPVMREVFASLGRGRAVNHGRTRLPIPGGFLQYGAGRWDDAGVYGYKVWANGGSPFVGVSNRLYALEDSCLLAVMESHHLSRCRTAAVSAVAAETLLDDASRPRVLAIIGTGKQAAAQIEALDVVLRLDRVTCYSRDGANREMFAADITSRFGLAAEAVADPEAAVSGADVVVTATSAKSPVLRGGWLRDTELILATGANRVYERELDAAAVEFASTVVVDDLVQARDDCGDLRYCVERGTLLWEQVDEFGPLVARRAERRGWAPPSGPIVFESLGLSITDVAISKAALDAARRVAAGTWLPTASVV